MNKADRIISVFLILFGGFVLFLARSLPAAPMKGTPGPAYFPVILSGILIWCAIMLYLRSSFEGNSTRARYEPHSAVRLLGTILLAIMTPVSLAYLGFVWTCLGSSLIFFLVLRVRWVTSLVTSAALTAGIYLVFHYGLRVQLPGGLF
jgi:putative tricarboxylic transport membrane protein